MLNVNFWTSTSGIEERSHLPGNIAQDGCATNRLNGAGVLFSDAPLYVFCCTHIVVHLSMMWIAVVSVDWVGFHVSTCFHIPLYHLIY